MGIDIPLTIALPDDIKETNYNKQFGKCVTVLECNVTYGNKGAIKSFMQLINVERYVMLPSATLFPKINKRSLSPDKKIIVTYSLENPCVSNDDLLRLNLDIKQNCDPSLPLNKRKNYKLKSIHFQLKETMEVYSKSSTFEEPRENIISTSSNQLTDQLISMNGINLKFNIKVSTKDPLFKNFLSTSQEPAFLFKLPSSSSAAAAAASPSYPIRTKLLQNKSNDIPLQYHTSISTRGKLFSVSHSLEMKFKLANAKDFQLTQRIDVSPWSPTKIKYIDQIINNEKMTAQFATKFYNNFGTIKKNSHSGNLEYPVLPPVIHYENAQEAVPLIE